MDCKMFKFWVQFFGRPIRPGNQHMPRPSMTGVNHPPNAAQAIPYPGQPMHGLNVSLCPFYNSQSWISGQLVNALLFLTATRAFRHWRRPIQQSSRFSLSLKVSF